MRPADTRLQSIGATFAVRYYTLLVQAPETLAALYTPTAHIVHSSHKATGAADINAHLVKVTAAGVTEAKLEDITTTRTPSGGIRVAIAGHLTRHGTPQAFTQEVDMREWDNNVFGITSDKLTYPAAAVKGQTAWAAPETPKQKAATPAPAAATPAAVADKPAAAAAAGVAGASGAAQKEAASSRKSTPAPAAETEAVPAAAAAAAAAPEPVKKPSSFAEALRMKKMSEGAAFSNKAARVVATSGEEDKAAGAAAAPAAGADKPEKKRAGKKDEKSSATPAKARAGEEASAVVYYDIILKELAASVTEEEVRALVTPVAAVKLVNIIKSEKRRRQKEGESAAPAITFAFVQLDRPADAPASHVKNVVAQLTAQNKELHAEEVREKKAPAHVASTRKPADAARGRKRPEHAPAAAGAPKAKAAAAAKPQQK